MENREKEQYDKMASDMEAKKDDFKRMWSEAIEQNKQLLEEIERLKSERNDNFKSRCYWKEQYDLLDIKTTQLQSELKAAESDK